MSNVLPGFPSKIYSSLPTYDEMSQTGNLTMGRTVPWAEWGTGALRIVEATEDRPPMRTVPKSHGRSSSFVLKVLKVFVKDEAARWWAANFQMS